MGATAKTLTNRPSSERVEQGAAVVELFPEGLSQVEQYTDEVTSIRVVMRKPMPMQLLERYVAGARRRAVPREEDGQWIAVIPGGGFEGVWATGDTASDALDEISDVLYDWAMLKITDEDRDLPVIDGIDLNVI